MAKARNVAEFGEVSI